MLSLRLNSKRPSRLIRASSSKTRKKRTRKKRTSDSINIVILVSRVIWRVMWRVM